MSDDESPEPATGGVPPKAGFGRLAEGLSGGFSNIGRNIMGNTPWMPDKGEPLGLLSEAPRVAIPTDHLGALANVRMDQSPRKTAKNTKVTAARMQELVALVNAELQISKDIRESSAEVRDIANTATDAAKRSGKHSIIIAYASLAISLASLAVAVATFIVTGQPPAPSP